MTQALELVRLSDSLALWQAYDPALKSDLYSTAVKISSGLFLIDPIPLAPSCLKELMISVKAAALLVTNLNHPRAAAAFAQELGAPVFAAAPVAAGFARGSCRPITDLEVIAPGVSVIAIDGAASGESAFHFADEGGTMVVGDALINFEPYGFTFLPAKYCSDAKAMRLSLRRLLDFSFERLLFAHGTPILACSRDRLETLLK